MGLLDKITGRDDALQKLVALKDQAVKARAPQDAECWQNLAFFHDKQWVEWDNGNLREIPRVYDPSSGVDERDLPRPVFNKIQSYIYTAQAETLQDKPSFDVLAANNDYQSRVDTEVSKGALDWVMEPAQIDWDKQLSLATLWALTAPSGYLKWIWDPVLNRPDAIPVPFPDLAIDPFATQFRRARYMIHTQFMDAAAVEDAFGVTVDKGDIGHSDQFKTQLLRDLGSAVLSEGVAVHELWMRPTKKYPRGVYAIYTGRKVYKIEDKLPYPHLIPDGGRLPFSQLGSLERADSLYYTSPVTALRPAQMVWNKFLAQAIQVYDAFANPKWWVPTELQLDELPNSSPRQILRGEGPAGVKPEIIQPSSAPDVTGLLNTFEQQMMHVVSVHEVSQGQVPGRVEAAKAIELLQSSDKGRYKHLLDTIDSALAEGGWHMLQLMKEYMPDGKMIPITSREGTAVVKSWRKSAVTPGISVRTVRMGGLGRTRAQRIDTLRSLWGDQIIKDPEVMAQLLELPRNTFTDPGAQDALLAHAENIELAQGTAVVPNSWDNHPVHIREHNDYRKSAEYRALDNDAKQKFEMHVGRHEELWIVEIKKQAARAGAMQPTLPAPAAGDGGQGSAAPQPVAPPEQGDQAPPQQG